MIKLHICFSNRTEYAVYNSLWASNLIAINMMRNNPQIEKIHITDAITGELYTTYYQGDSIRNICNDDRPIFTEVTQ